jgi:hypothetical protein
LMAPTSGRRIGGLVSTANPGGTDPCCHWDAGISSCWRRRQRAPARPLAAVDPPHGPPAVTARLHSSTPVTAPPTSPSCASVP